ncbi:type 2 periplasmic-binding domain-containing protein [Cohnella fermenti]|uniref:extracellular solute-binding protein n=1 Tax=Cohnella fermenti TaxID=2565925 RepID=UPI001454D741|nr:extracellular solute-binding protein [Cohnella fermenti]
MNKHLAKGLLLALLGSMLLTACSNNSNNDANNGNTGSIAPTSSSAPEETQTTGYNGVDILKVSKEPVTVSLFYSFGINGAPKGDMPVWKKTAEITNVTMKNVANESISDDQQSLNTMLASGDIPDIIQGSLTMLNPVISQGVFIALDDLVDQYAPNIKKFLEDYPDARRAGTAPDGSLYAITGTLGGEPGKALPAVGYFVRQDWLDKLNLQKPTTLEEYKDVLYAFRNQDPNGNNKKDEIPYFFRDKGIANLLQLWGAHKDWYIGEDDKVHQGKAEPEYKAAMKELAQWYKDGIIDPEIFTRGSQARQYLLGNNLGGSTIDWFASTSAVNDAVREQVPDINFAAIAPPADVNGAVKMDITRPAIHGMAWGISSAAKDPVTVIKYLDFFFSEPGEMLMNYGIEGEDYTVVDGKPVPSDEAINYPTGFPFYLRSIGAGYEIGRRGSSDSEVNTMNEIGKAGFTMYADSNWLTQPFPTLSYTEEERKAIDDAMVNLKPFIDEYEQKVLMGAENIDSSWDKHLEEMNKMNLQKALGAYNSAYDRYKTDKN